MKTLILLIMLMLTVGCTNRGDRVYRTEDIGGVLKRVDAGDAVCFVSTSGHLACKFKE